jgi:hypothetical protein
MNRIKEKKFIKTIKQKGITIDSSYPDSAEVSFKNDLELSRFWKIPEGARRIPYFVDTILGALDPWESAYVWKHLGSWVSRVKGERLNDDLQAVIYRGVGIADDNADILEFKRNELHVLIALIFNQLVFGWHVEDDLYIIPNHGKQIIKTDHHDVVHVLFRDDSTMKQFIEEMSKNGFELPNDLPDETLKKPDWMKITIHASGRDMNRAADFGS